MSTPIGLIDLVPTLLDLVGGSFPYPFHGESLVAHLRQGTPLRSPWVLSEAGPASIPNRCAVSPL